MKKQPMASEIKVGLFALAALLIIGYATVKVSEQGFGGHRTYTVYAYMTSAEGLTPKTPVEIAGIQVGTLGKAELEDGRVAKVTLKIRKDVQITRDAAIQVRTKGFLGETYIDIQQGDPESGYLGPDDAITASNSYADISQLTSKLNGIADDVQTMTTSIKSLFDDDGQGAPIREIVMNLRDFTADLKNFSGNNAHNMNRIVYNLAELTEQMRILVLTNRDNINETMYHVQNIARKIDEGQGTLGRLINDDTTIDNLNEAVEGLNETLGGIRRFQFVMGYHLEYLGRSNNFKNYVHLGLRPRPDREFMFDFISDTNPPADRQIIDSTVTVGGTTTTVQTERTVTNRDKFLFSAQFAQWFYNFRLRGGLIESRAGLGVDYRYGPFMASVSAFDFNEFDQGHPHIKGWGTLNLTKTFYLTSGVDAPPNFETNWFVGAGFRFVDNDVKSILGLGAAAAGP